MDKNLRLLTKFFDWNRLEKAGFDKYEAIVVSAKYARYLFQKSREQNLKLPTRPIFMAIDALLNKKVPYKK